MHIPTPADAGQASSIADDLMAQAEHVQSMTGAVAKARTVLAYSGDRLKRALALAITDAKAAGASSHAEADGLARSSEAYRDALADLAKADMQAERVVSEWEAAKMKWESLRSILSIEKHKMNLL